MLAPLMALSHYLCIILYSVLWLPSWIKCWYFVDRTRRKHLDQISMEMPFQNLKMGKPIE